MHDEEAVRSLLERERVAEVVNTLFLATDAREWSCVRSCFAPVVTFDMTSVAGGQVQHLSPEQIASGWEAGLRPIESVHHQTGNLAVTCTGVDAQASCYGIAYRFIEGEPTWSPRPRSGPSRCGASRSTPGRGA